MKPFGVLVGADRRPAAVFEVVSDVDVAYIIIRAKPEAGEDVGRIRIAATQAGRLEVVPVVSGSDDPVEVFLGIERHMQEEGAK